MPLVARVLLIGKQPHMVELLRPKFEAEGFAVLWTQDGPGAVQLATQEEPDLIVVDEKLMDGNGQPVSESLKAVPALQETPVILLTSRDSAAGEGSNGGGTSVVQMPFRPSQLLALVRKNLH